MARRDRVYGPYRHRNRWRVEFVGADGQRARQSFETEGEAAAFAAEERARLEGLQVSDAIAAYLEDGRARELRASTLASTGHRLRTLLQADRGRTGGLLADVTPARARALLAAMGEGDRPRSVAYRRGTLAEAGTFARWCVARKLLRADPFAGLKVLGRVRTGKPQHTIDQARAFGATCLELVNASDEAALAVLLLLVEGCRASEVTDRVVGDVDDGGAILWITRAKTPRGRRNLEVPPYLQGALLALCHDEHGRRRPDAEPIFGADRDEPVDRQWLYYHVGRICRLAKVPEVCPQSLRGLHATLATQRNRTSHDVAAALGHTSAVVTHRHYIDPGATASAANARVLAVLAGQPVGETAGTTVPPRSGGAAEHDALN